MKLPVCLLFILLSFQLQAQNSNKVSVQASYGLNGNFFVRSYDETGGPDNKVYLYKKKFIGTIAGVELSYHLNNYSSILAGYSRSTNKGKKNYNGSINGVNIFVNDFNIIHNNDFYQLGYERKLKKLIPNFKYHVGVVLAVMEQQEISIENFSNQIVIDERNFKNSRLQEGGIFGGIEWAKKIDTKFEAGIKIRAYYLLSVQSFEAITLTPVLTYTF